jgi:hypothetical protein
MARQEIISHHSSGNTTAVNVIVYITLESEGESRPARIHLPYRDVRKFWNDGLEVEKIPKMLWKILQELGYEKQLEYFGTQVTYEGSEPVWHVQLYIFTPKPLRGVYEMEKIHTTIASRHSFNIGICDAAAHQAYMVTHSRYCQLLDGMKYAHFPQWASGSTYIHVELVQDEINFKLMKQVALTATLTKELDSTTKEVEFGQGKYEGAMKTIRKMKCHCPQETLLYEETEEFNPHTPPCARWLHVHLLPTSFPMMLKAMNNFLLRPFVRDRRISS